MAKQRTDLDFGSMHQPLNTTAPRVEAQVAGESVPEGLLIPKRDRLVSYPIRVPESHMELARELAPRIGGNLQDALRKALELGLKEIQALADGKEKAGM